MAAGAKESRCRLCGATIPSGQLRCPNCLRAVHEPDPKEISELLKRRERFTITQTVAGLFLIAAGLVAFWTGMTISLERMNDPQDWLGFAELFAGLVVMLAGLFSIAGYNLPFVTIGAVVAVFTVGPYFISSGFGAIGFALVAISWKGYE